MRITTNLNVQKITQQLQALQKQIEDNLYKLLISLSLEEIEKAVAKGTYQNWTFNLRSSISAAIFKNGKLVYVHIADENKKNVPLAALDVTENDRANSRTSLVKFRKDTSILKANIRDAIDKIKAFEKETTFEVFIFAGMYYGVDIQQKYKKTVLDPTGAENEFFQLLKKMKATMKMHIIPANIRSSELREIFVDQSEFTYEPFIEQLEEYLRTIGGIMI